MPLWIVSSAGIGRATHWNQPPSSSRLTRKAPPSTWTSMMIVACGMPSFSARMTPTWPKPWSSDCSPQLFLNLLHQQGAIRAAEAEGVGKGVTNLHRTRFVRDVVEVAGGVGVVEVDRRRRDLVLDRQRGDARFEAAGSAEQMPGH